VLKTRPAVAFHPNFVMPPRKLSNSFRRCGLLPHMENVLYFGDNLDIIRRYLTDESVDLVYADPPFNSNQNYNVLFQEKDGTRAASQIRAFEDTWTWDSEDEAVYADLVTAGGKVAEALQAFRQLIGPCDMLSYLVMMAPRLIECRRVLKSTGSMYLHCDASAGAYLRLLMDAVFGYGNFRNEIIWYYYNKMHDRRKKMFPKANDIVLFYVKDVKSDFTFMQLKEMREAPIRQLARKKVDGRMVNVKGPDGKCVYRVKEDRTLDNVWRIPCLQPASHEMLGYPTQKPVVLLERIIQASSNPGDVVMDPFCGCGTTVTAAQTLGRTWIGIDITHLSITLMKERLKDTFGAAAKFKVVGEPTSAPDAAALAASDPYQFQWWSLGLVGARPVEEKKGADKGIDGKIVFQGDSAGKFESVIISVKAGNTGVAHVRDLRGVLDREKASIGVLITMQEHTKPMLEEAVTAGFYESKMWGKRYPKIQLFTVADLLAGKQIEMPPIKQVGATFKKAPRAAAKPDGAQGELSIGG
jgi:DNA modification methylase